jgi:hypothetical protein
MSRKFSLLLLVLGDVAGELLALRILPTAADHDDDHHYVPGRYAASERWDVSVSSGSKLLSADAAWAGVALKRATACVGQLPLVDLGIHTC